MHSRSSRCDLSIYFNNAWHIFFVWIWCE